MPVRDTSQADPELTRELASWGHSEDPVLTLLMDLDPERFATAEARASEISSLVDQAHALVEAAGLEHDGHASLRALVDQARAYLESGDYASGARGLALFARPEGEELLAVRLTVSVATRAVLDRWPLLAPLTREPATAWGVAVVDRRHARLLRGGPARLEQAGELTENDDRESHTHGYLSEEMKAHLDRTSEALRVAHRHRPLDALLLGGHQELLGEAEARLPPELGERLRGSVTVDVKATPEEVLQAARPEMEREHERRIDEAVERLGSGAAHGKGALGLEDVLETLTERRVEILLLEDDLVAPGVECPACGWLGPEGRDTCPADDTQTQRRDDVVAALGRAAEQDAAVLFLHERDDVRANGGIAAVLRF